MTNSKRRLPRSTWLPLALLAYLGVMAYIGRDALKTGESLRYFSIIGVSLVVIVALHFFLRKREWYARRRNDIDKNLD